MAGGDREEEIPEARRLEGEGEGDLRRPWGAVQYSSGGGRR